MIKLQYQTKTAESLKRNEKDRERKAQLILQKKGLQNEDGEVQDLAVPKYSRPYPSYPKARIIRKVNTSRMRKLYHVVDLSGVAQPLPSGLVKGRDTPDKWQTRVEWTEKLDLRSRR